MNLSMSINIQNKRNKILRLQELVRKNMLLTVEHSRRVKEIAVDFGKFLGFNTLLLKSLTLLAEYHDIGKITIPESILLKTDSLSPEEWEILKKHTVTGYRLALFFKETTLIAEGILAHHERWDGLGYPLGLEGEEIPAIARIISILDTYDALTYDRAYRKAVSPKLALKEIKMCSGTQFDPELVQAFISFALNGSLK